jgi:hypothetical protein
MFVQVEFCKAVGLFSTVRLSIAKQEEILRALISECDVDTVKAQRKGSLGLLFTLSSTDLYCYCGRNN